MESRTFPLPVEEAFDRVLPLPLEELFVRRYGPIPAVRTTVLEGSVDAWAEVGQRRVVEFAGPGAMCEELTVVDRPHRFGYVLTEISGPMKSLATRVEGTWSFDEVGTGVRITWAWTVHPAGRVGALAMPAFSKLWTGYARQSLARLEKLLLEG